VPTAFFFETADAVVKIVKVSINAHKFESSNEPALSRRPLLVGKDAD